MQSDNLGQRLRTIRLLCYQQNGANFALPVNVRMDLTAWDNNEAYTWKEVNDILQANIADI